MIVSTKTAPKDKDIIFIEKNENGKTQDYIYIANDGKYDNDDEYMDSFYEVIKKFKLTDKEINIVLYYAKKKDLEINKNDYYLKPVIEKVRDTLEKINKKILYAKNGNYFQLMPYIDVNNYENIRRCIYLYGPSGSGKSTFIKNFVHLFNKIYGENRPCFLFSEIKEGEDVTYMNDKLFNYVNINGPELFNIDVDTLENSIVIFDDINFDDGRKIKNKSAISNFISNLQTKILARGRHKNITCFITSHIFRTSNKLFILECDTIVFFGPSTYGTCQTYLYNNFGIKKKLFNEIITPNIKYVLYNKKYNLLASDKKIILI